MSANSLTQRVSDVLKRAPEGLTTRQLYNTSSVGAETTTQVSACIHWLRQKGLVTTEIRDNNDRVHFWGGEQAPAAPPKAPAALPDEPAKAPGTSEPPPKQPARRNRTEAGPPPRKKAAKKKAAKAPPAADDDIPTLGSAPSVRPASVRAVDELLEQQADNALSALANYLALEGDHTALELYNAAVAARQALTEWRQSHV